MTPRFGDAFILRRLLMFGDVQKLRQIKLVQITLGGEVVDQHVLDLLKVTFPEARIAHIYATSEPRTLFFGDRWTRRLSREVCGRAIADGIEIKIEDGELFVRSANAMQGYDNALEGRSPRRSVVRHRRPRATRRRSLRFRSRKSDCITSEATKCTLKRLNRCCVRFRRG